MNGHFFQNFFRMMVDFDMRHFYLTILCAFTRAFYLQDQSDPNFEDCP